MHTTSHVKVYPTRRHLGDGRTVRYERPARTVEQRRAIIEQMGGVR